MTCDHHHEVIMTLVTNLMLAIICQQVYKYESSVPYNALRNTAPARAIIPSTLHSICAHARNNTLRYTASVRMRLIISAKHSICVHVNDKTLCNTTPVHMRTIKLCVTEYMHACTLSTTARAERNTDLARCNTAWLVPLSGTTQHLTPDFRMINPGSHPSRSQEKHWLSGRPRASSFLCTFSVSRDTSRVVLFSESERGFLAGSWDWTSLNLFSPRSTGTTTVLLVLTLLEGCIWLVTSLNVNVTSSYCYVTS